MKQALRLLVLPFAALCLALAPAADKLEFRVAAKSKLTRTLESKVEADSTSFAVTLGGEDLGDIGTPKIRIEQTETVRVTDEYESVADGRATKLVRKYDELAGTEMQSFHAPGGASGDGEEKTSEKQSALEGQSVVFTWDDADDEYGAAWAEGSKGDDELLDDLTASYDFTEFLPGKPVASGDTWELGKPQFAVLFSPSGELGLESADDEDDESELTQSLLENLGGKGKATYKGLREGEGNLAMIAIEAELRTTGASDQEDGENELSIQLELEGEILWDVDEGRLHSFSIDGKVAVTQTIRSSVDVPSGRQDVEQKIEFAGTQKLTGSVDG